jgi:hypothetical protein
MDGGRSQQRVIWQGNKAASPVSAVQQVRYDSSSGSWGSAHDLVTTHEHDRGRIAIFSCLSPVRSRKRATHAPLCGPRRCGPVVPLGPSHTALALLPTPPAASRCNRAVLLPARVLRICNKRRGPRRLDRCRAVSSGARRPLRAPIAAPQSGPTRGVGVPRTVNEGAGGRPRQAPVDRRPRPGSRREGSRAGRASGPRRGTARWPRRVERGRRRRHVS